MAKVKLGDFEVTLNGELPKVGSPLPNFLLADGDLNNVDLEQFKGKRLVLNIFPSMNTPVCSASVVQSVSQQSQLTQLSKSPQLQLLQLQSLLQQSHLLY